MTSHIWHRYEVCIYDMPVLYASRENHSENKFELLPHAYLESDMRGLIIPCPVLVAASHTLSGGSTQARCLSATADVQNW
jgi:hypothetical protein